MAAHLGEALGAYLVGCFLAAVIYSHHDPDLDAKNTMGKIVWWPVVFIIWLGKSLCDTVYEVWYDS